MNRTLSLFTILGLCIVLGSLFSFLALIMVEPIFGLKIGSSFDLLQLSESAEGIAVMKFIQFMNSVGIFVLPSIVFVLLFASKPLSFLKLNQGVHPFSFLLLVFIFFSFLPLVNWSVEWNSTLKLPESLASLEEWMRLSEDNASRLTKVFLQMDSPLELFYNLFLIALLPAIGEELVFRGIVQQTINRGKRNPHLGIWIAAILFSALHLQFYGFVPRMLLGALFGYLFFWSNSLWIPICAHFINNATAVLATYFLGTEAMEEKIDKFGTTSDSFLYLIISTFFFLGLLVVFARFQSKESS